LDRKIYLDCSEGWGDSSGGSSSAPGYKDFRSSHALRKASFRESLLELESSSTVLQQVTLAFPLTVRESFSV
jgi:hypothetical protein